MNTRFMQATRISVIKIVLIAITCISVIVLCVLLYFRVGSESIGFMLVEVDNVAVINTNKSTNLQFTITYLAEHDWPQSSKTIQVTDRELLDKLHSMSAAEIRNIRYVDFAYSIPGNVVRSNEALSFNFNENTVYYVTDWDAYARITGAQVIDDNGNSISILQQ
ncbi:hypothetical protein BHAP_1426 [Bifidobacterium hapali]|uniref:Uncharacterized protein n=1 Tax=Bifidobacterium hapali TaxID=1630172 RepID=A0A261FY99_9BIFI|nr:hypothetical protein [Bifidobacterium hapali]OZG63923.1 hypothetical protein BHAP_1426 [Bifidobacterium hapali]